MKTRAEVAAQAAASALRTPGALRVLLAMRICTLEESGSSLFFSPAFHAESPRDAWGAPGHSARRIAVAAGWRCDRSELDGVGVEVPDLDAACALLTEWAEADGWRVLA